MKALMKAMVLEKPGMPLRMVERDTPEPRAGEVLVKVHACAVCRTDLHVAQGDLTQPKLPIVLGHEVVGRRAVRIGAAAVVTLDAMPEAFSMGVTDADGRAVVPLSVAAPCTVRLSVVASTTSQSGIPGSSASSRASFSSSRDPSVRSIKRPMSRKRQP